MSCTAVFEVWSAGAKVAVHAAPAPYGGSSPSYYMACETCGACSEHYNSRERVRRMAIEHTQIDHSEYEPQEPDDGDD